MDTIPELREAGALSTVCQLSSDWGWLDCEQVFSKPNIGYETVDILTLQGEAGVC